MLNRLSFKPKKGDFEIDELIKWVLVIISVVVLLWLAANWAISAISVNPF